MKRLLLLAGLIGFAIYLLNSSRTPPMEPTETVSTVQATPDRQIDGPATPERQTAGPLKSSWGSNLQTLAEEPEVPSTEDQQPAPSKTASSGLVPHTNTPQSQPTRNTETPVAEGQVSASSTNNLEQEATEWIRIDQVVMLRSEPSLSSPELRSYPAGSKAQVVKRKNGWIQLLDPATKERGWVYHAYASSIDSSGEAPLKAMSEMPRSQIASPPRRSTSTPKPAVRASDPATANNANSSGDQTARTFKRRRGLGFFKWRRARRASSTAPE